MEKEDLAVIMASRILRESQYDYEALDATDPPATIEDWVAMLDEEQE